MKKCLAFCLSLVLALPTAALPVLAEDAYMQGFSKTQSYTNGQFTDIGEEWYADSVRSVYETGLMKGTGEHTFDPNGNLTNAEAVAVAARIHSIYHYGNENFSATAPWYQAYIDYAVANHLCDNNFSPEDTAQRAFFAGMVGNATDSSVLPEKNDIADNSLPDVNGWYAGAVYKLYRAGILCGNDKHGTFAPESSITRAEVAAIISRIVKPSERLTFTLETKPTATYSILPDDGSLAAFKQRAVLANLKVLLNGEPKDEKWNTDVLSKFHAAVPGDDIFVSKRDIELRYFSTDISSVYVPNRYFGEPGDAYKLVGDWSLFSGFRSYLDGYKGSMPNGEFGDLYLSKPAKAAYTETYTYDSFTAEAQSLIQSAAFTIPAISEDAVAAHIKETYGDSANASEIYVGYLADWQGVWYITMNKSNMYKPTPRENNSYTQSEYIFTPTDAKTKEWCQNHWGKYVVAYVNAALDEPLMLSEISGYADTRDKAKVQSWDYTNGVLTLTWQPINKVTFINPIIIIDSQKRHETLDTTGLVPAYRAGTTGTDLYRIDYADSYDDFSNRTFHMTVDGDSIYIEKINNSIQNQLSQGNEPNHQSIRLTINSNTAIIDGLPNDIANLLGQEFGDYSGKTVTVSPKPKKIHGTIYLPPEFIIQTLYKDKLNYDYDDLGVTDFEYDENGYPIIEGYARVCNDSRNQFTYYLKGHEKTTFRFSQSSGIKGYDLYISKTHSGPHVGFNLNSKKACVQVWYNGSEYGEKVFTIPEPKKIYGDFYLPIEILDLLNSTGKGWKTHTL